MSQQKNSDQFSREQDQQNYKLVGEDYVICILCGFKASKDLMSHLRYKHAISPKEYKIQTGYDVVSLSYARKRKQNMSGENNPGFNHGGRLSPYSKSFVGGYDSSVIDKVRETKDKNNSHTSRLSYYTSKGLSEEEAIEALRDRQSTFSKEKCIKRYGYEEGLHIFNKRQEKWQSTLKSKPPQEIARINKAKTENIVDYRISSAEREISNFLTKQGLDIETQFYINYADRSYWYDIKCGNRIIEYNGDYWHANPLIYEETSEMKKRVPASDIWERDKKKSDVAVLNGYEIKYVWEREFLNNKEKVLQECLSFMIQ